MRRYVLYSIGLALPYVGFSTSRSDRLSNHPLFIPVTGKELLWFSIVSPLICGLLILGSLPAALAMATNKDQEGSMGVEEQPATT